MSKIIFADGEVNNNCTMTCNGVAKSVIIERDVGTVTVEGTRLDASTLNGAFAEKEDVLEAGENVEIKDDVISFKNEYMPEANFSEIYNSSGYYNFNKDEWKLDTNSPYDIRYGGNYIADVGKANDCVMEFDLEGIHLSDVDDDPTIVVRFMQDSLHEVHCLFRLKLLGIRIVDSDWTTLGRSSYPLSTMQQPAEGENIKVCVVRLTKDESMEEYRFYYNGKSLGSLTAGTLGLVTVGIGTVGCKADKLSNWKLSYLN